MTPRNSPSGENLVQAEVGEIDVPFPVADGSRDETDQRAFGVIAAARSAAHPRKQVVVSAGFFPMVGAR
jgi:hypothetical protein